MHVALVGGGVIGGGWAGRLVENGVDVTIHDPHPEAERRVREVLDNAERAWARLTLVPRARGAVSFADSLEEAVADAAVIQESAPEDEALKRRLLAEIDRHAPPEALVCSSTSGLLPSRLQLDMTHPERFLVGHPFNPVYLLPLVEVVAGELTSENAVARALDFYVSLGMKPLRIRKEVDGFVADRLLEALWREALWLVHDDVATVEEVDDAVRYGPGLRWAQMGTFLTYRIAGGEGGMRHFLAQFGPALGWPWTKLTDVPELTDELVEKIAAQSDAQAGGLTVRELERLRDDNLVALLQALRARDYAAEKVLRAHEARLLEAPGNGFAAPDPTQPLLLHETLVEPEWIDCNGHLTEARYLHVFAEATDAFLRYVGVGAEYLAGSHSAYTVETHLRHLREVAALEPLQVLTQVLGADEKRLHLFHTMRHATAGETLATAEHLLLHVNTAEGRARPWLEPVAGSVATAAAAHRALPLPESAGRAIVLRRGLETQQHDTGHNDQGAN
ncbi:MAG: carnitine 3-dehydrogenase [Actinobacteria bacterium]|nr:carnitine 3-dehydrogenase [Actinomycetota bacterium]